MAEFGLSAFDLQGLLPFGCHGEALGWRLGTPGAEHPCLVSSVVFSYLTAILYDSPVLRIPVKIDRERSECDSWSWKGGGEKTTLGEVKGHKITARMTKSHYGIAQNGGSG